MKAASSAMSVKTDCKDAGACPVDPAGLVLSGGRQIIGSQEVRALLVACKQLLGRPGDVELSFRGILLRGFGLKVGQVTHKGILRIRFENW